jgi:hypothetical protein
MVEADVLLEDHHDMLDGGGGAMAVGLLRGGGSERGRSPGQAEPAGRYGGEHTPEIPVHRETSTLVAIATLTMAGQASRWVNGGRRRG